MPRDLSLRDRLFVLLMTAILLGTSSSAVAIWSLGRVARSGHELARLESGVSQTLGRVAAGHLQQIAALEWALWEERGGPGPSPAEARFEERAASSWRALQEARTLVGQGENGMDAEALLRGLNALDRAHNDYALRARSIFDLLEHGRRADARVGAVAAEAESQRFQSALDEVLAIARSAAEVNLERLETEQEQATLLVASLSVAAVIMGIAIAWRAVVLVGELRSLTGLLPICASCKSIRDDQGYWNQLELYVENHSEAQFTHGLCEPCVEKLKEQASAG
jgi:hypothetical protein